MFAVFLTTAGIILGVATGLSVTFALTEAFGLRLASPSILGTRALNAPLGLAVVGAFVVGISVAVSLRTRRSLVLPSGALCALGVVVALGVGHLDGLGPLAAAGVAATVLGCVGRLLALRLGAPAMVLAVPASYGLLPGLAIFRGLYEMVNGSKAGSGTLSQQGGITTLLGAMAVLLAIAAGSVLGGAGCRAVRPPDRAEAPRPASVVGTLLPYFPDSGCPERDPPVPCDERFSRHNFTPHTHTQPCTPPRRASSGGVSPEDLRADEDGGPNSAAMVALG